MHNVHGHAADAAASDRKKFRRSSSEKAQWFECVKLQNWNFYSFCLQNFWHENSINLSSQYVANYFCFYFPSLYSLCFSLHKCKQFAKASVTNNLDDALFSGFFFDRSEY